MRIAFIGDIVGRPGREMVKEYLKGIRDKYGIDFVIANYENASHGFGLTPKNSNELFSYGIDVMSGGNHSWDKKEIVALFDTHEILRPYNYPAGVAGSGCRVYEVAGEKLAVLNLMGYYGMPMCDNAFRAADQKCNALHEEGIKNIFVDFHAEATAEKRIMMQLLKGKVSAICGTHTHVGTDDLEITKGTFYVSDIGLTGCRDNVIGMDSKIPIKKALTGLGGHFEIPNSCKTIMQIIIIDIDEDGKSINAKKIKLYNNQSNVISEPIIN